MTLRPTTSTLSLQPSDVIRRCASLPDLRQLSKGGVTDPTLLRYIPLPKFNDDKSKLVLRLPDVVQPVLSPLPQQPLQPVKPAWRTARPRRGKRAEDPPLTVDTNIAQQQVTDQGNQERWSWAPFQETEDSPEKSGGGDTLSWSSWKPLQSTEDSLEKGKEGRSSWGGGWGVPVLEKTEHPPSSPSPSDPAPLPPWKPAWHNTGFPFPLKVFRGTATELLKVRWDWDDHDLLRELNTTYDKMRTVWRKYLSLRSVRCVQTRWW